MRKNTQIAFAQQGLRWLVAITVVWVLLLFLLMGWWGWIVYSQAQKIAELQTLAGQSSSHTYEDWSRTQRMLVGEASAYFVLLAGLSGAMMWLYWRDRRRTRALHTFLAAVTHELKTPLTSIRLQAEALEGTTPQNELIERLLEDTSRLEAQVEKTLELARLEGGGELMLEPLPIQSWLQRFCANVHESAVRIELANEDSAQHWLVLADRSALQIVFRNLIENTARHSQTSPARMRIRLAAENGEVRVVCSDEGQGFNGEVHRLGSLFFRGSRSQGAGVGLYLVQSLMSHMGGRARFDTTPGRGFETRLYFRRAEEPA